MNAESSDSERQERFERIQIAYVQAVEAGQPVDQAKMLEENPDLAWIPTEGGPPNNSACKDSGTPLESRGFLD